MAFNSDEVNLLVYRYLEESGFRHSAFTFGYESNVLNAGIDNTSIPRGALMSLLQKGVLFAEAEVFSLLNDGELDARFEKAIGCMTILECAMCDSAKIKALQRRTGIQQRSATNDEQHQMMNTTTQSNPRRTPTRTVTVPTTTTTMADSDHKQQTSSQSSANTQQINQIHGQIPCRSDSATSVKSIAPSFQQQQLHRDRDFRVQQQSSTTINQMLTSNANIPQRSSHRTIASAQDERIGLYEHAGSKCNPTLATSSTAGSVPLTTSNHLHSSANTALVGMHPFYIQQQQQSFAKQGIGLGHSDSNASFLTAANNANGGGPTNGPNCGSGHTMQINSSTTSPFPSLSALHHLHQSSSIINGTTPYLAASSTTGPSAKRTNGNG